ncbi:MAG: mechanosensitive ion channel family protein [Desulfatiglans sp.]|nr:mechanosensitive ion channel family protein [Desulfatiglans sp.]
METILTFQLAGNSIRKILVFFIVILFSLLIGKIAKMLFNRSSEQFDSQGLIVASTTLDALARSSVLLFAAFGIYIGMTFLDLHTKFEHISRVSSGILLTVAIGNFLYWLADIPAIWFSKFARNTDSTLDDMMSPIIRKSLRWTIVILALVQIVQTVSDKPITSIVAGLGIGGLAVALAAQDSIKNFFGSIVLFVDKPFEIGNRVVVDGHDGVVETIGFRSTKIRNLDGHLITIPNGELANKMIRNIGKRPYIKRTANITITYDTPPEKIESALEIIKGLLANHEGMDEAFPPRVSFSEFNADSLNILVIYWYHPPDYWAYMDFSERFNKELFRRFNEEGIDFAFPTQTVYLAGDKARPLTIGVNNNEQKGG